MVARRRAPLPAVRAGQSAPAATPARSGRLTRFAVNLAGAAGAAFFAVASFQFYLQTHSLIGAGFCVEQAWFVVAFLVRRPAQAVTRRSADWLLTVGGSFGGTGFRPAGLHPAWGLWSGLALQTAGLIIGLASLLALGRSFGVVPADRGLVTWGPYAVVRHPIYSSYLLVQCGYLLQSLSWRNALVLACTAGCNIGRALAEERLLTASAVPAAPAGRPPGGPAPVPAAIRPAARTADGGQAWAGDYLSYRERVRWRLAPGLW